VSGPSALPENVLSATAARKEVTIDLTFITLVIVTTVSGFYPIPLGRDVQDDPRLTGSVPSMQDWDRNFGQSFRLGAGSGL